MLHTSEVFSSYIHTNTPIYWFEAEIWDTHENLIQQACSLMLIVINMRDRFRRKEEFGPVTCNEWNKPDWPLYPTTNGTKNTLC